MKTAYKYRVLIIFLIAVVVVGLAVLLMVQLFKPEPVDPHEGQVYINDGFGMVWITPLEGVDVNPLKSEDFKMVNGEPVLTRDGYTVSRGIDVSEHQLEIDWAEASKHIDYAYIRLGYRGSTEGGLYEDPYFKANMDGATSNGLQTGVYFFSQALSVPEAVEEAEFVIERLKDYNVDLPVVFDWEKLEGGGRSDQMDPQLLTDCAVAFCETIKEAGYTPAVYFNRYLGYYMYDLSKLTDYEFWLAVPGEFPDFYYESEMWQYSFESKIPGISELTDMNLRLIPDPVPEGEEEEIKDKDKKKPEKTEDDEYSDLPVVEYKK